MVKPLVLPTYSHRVYATYSNSKVLSTISTHGIASRYYSYDIIAFSFGLNVSRTDEARDSAYLHDGDETACLDQVFFGQQ